MGNLIRTGSLIFTMLILFCTPQLQANNHAECTEINANYMTHKESYAELIFKNRRIEHGIKQITAIRTELADDSLLGELHAQLLQEQDGLETKLASSRNRYFDASQKKTDNNC